MTTKTIITASRYLKKSRESNARERRGTIMGDLNPSTAREKYWQVLLTSVRSSAPAYHSYCTYEKLQYAQSYYNVLITVKSNEKMALKFGNTGKGMFQ